MEKYGGARYKRPKAKKKGPSSVGKAIKRAGKGRSYKLADPIRKPARARQPARSAPIRAVRPQPKRAKPRPRPKPKKKTTKFGRAYHRELDAQTRGRRKKLLRQIGDFGEPIHKDLKVAGLNIDKITGKGGRAAIDVLEETTRPLHAVSAGLREQVKIVKKGGGNPLGVPKAALRGLQNKDKSTMSDVLREAGVEKALSGTGLGKKGARTVTSGLGLGADFVVDPLNLTGVGAVAVPARVGTKAALLAKTGKVSKKAPKIKHKAADKKVGVRVGPKTVNTRIPLPQMSDKARHRVRKVFPVRHPDLTEAEHQLIKGGERRRRGFITTESRRVSRKAKAVEKGLGGAQRRVIPERPVEGAKRRVKPRRRTAPIEASRRVADAIEAQDLAKLSPNERAAVQGARDMLEEDIALRAAAGEKPKRYAQRTPDEPKGYVPRLTTAALDEPVRKRVRKQQPVKEGKERASHGRPSRMTTTPGDAIRKDRRPLNVAREAEPEKWVEDLPTLLRAKGQKGVTSAGNTRFRNEIIGGLGRKAEKNTPMKPDEAVYVVKQASDEGPTRLVEAHGAELGKALNRGDAVVIKKAAAERANRAVQHSPRVPGLDRGTSEIKKMLTVINPQYWTRNYYGGMMNVYAEGAKGPGLVKAILPAHAVARRQSKLAKAEETLGAAPKKPSGTIDMGKAGKMKIDDLIDEIEHENITGGGLTSELLGSESRRRSKMQVFEDAPRLAAYIYHRRRGASSTEAVKRSMSSQFDYGDLTWFEENVARRIFPFYTWRSRNIALQGKTLVQRPSKLSHLEATREEMAKHGGLPSNWQDQLTDAEAGLIPFPTKGGMYAIAPPTTDLNLFTTDPGTWIQQAGGMLHPGVKSPIEFITGYSLFFKGQIAGEGRQWFAAPDKLINQLPTPLRKKLEKDGIIQMGTDRWTGERTWQWRAKTDYLAKTIPILSVLGSALTSSKSRKGQTAAEREAAWLSGVRKLPRDKKLSELYKLYEEIGKNKQAEASIRELGNHKHKSGQWTPEYAKIQKERGVLEKRRIKLEKATGKKVTKWPRKPRSDSEEEEGGGTGLWTGGGSKPKGGQPKGLWR